MPSNYKNVKLGVDGPDGLVVSSLRAVVLQTCMVKLPVKVKL